MANLNLSIIILSYNTKDITDECLSRLRLSVLSCQKKLANQIETLVIDNASDDGSAEMVKKNHPWVKLIESKENTGYSKGNNIGISQSKFPLILLLNSDVYLEEDTLEKALDYFNNPDCDVLGPQMVFENGQFQPSAGNLPTPFNTISWILGLSLIPGVGSLTNPFHPNYKDFFEKERKVGWITGAFFMFKREIYEKINGLDENIFMYLEEVEFCKRITMAGFKIWYVPAIKIIHLHGASSNFDSSVALLGELTGLKYYFQKYYSQNYPLVKFFLILGLILRVIAFSFFGKTKKARVYIQGLGVI